MKNIFKIFITSLVLSSIVNASACKHEREYVKQGWVVHPSTMFSMIEAQINQRIDQGEADESLQYDIYARYNFKFGYEPNPDFLVDMDSWDDVNTPHNEMWGDIAVYTSFIPVNEVVEIHWYEGGKRHIVINPNKVTCINMPPTRTENSVF